MWDSNDIDGFITPDHGIESNSLGFLPLRVPVSKYWIVFHGNRDIHRKCIYLSLSTRVLFKNCVHMSFSPSLSCVMFDTVVNTSSLTMHWLPSSCNKIEWYNLVVKTSRIYPRLVLFSSQAQDSITFPCFLVVSRTMCLVLVNGLWEGVLSSSLGWSI